MLLGIMLQVLALLGGAGGILVGLSFLAGMVREDRFGYRRSEPRSGVGRRLATGVGSVVVWFLGLSGVTAVLGFDTYTWFYILGGDALLLSGIIGLGLLWLGSEFQKANRSPWLIRLVGGLGLLSEGTLLWLGVTGYFSKWGIMDWGKLIATESGVLILGVRVVWRSWKRHWETAILEGANRAPSHFGYWLGLGVETLLLWTGGSIVTALVINHFLTVQKPLQSRLLFFLAMLALFVFLVSVYYYIFLLGPISEHGYKVLLCFPDRQQWRVWLMDEDKKYFYIATSREKAQQIGCNVEEDDPKVVVVAVPKEEVVKIVFLKPE